MQIGHRISIDIDLFGPVEIEPDDFIQVLNQFQETHIIKKSKNILIVSVNGIKVDFVNYKYPMIGRVKEFNGISLASIEDIAAMKLNAIAGRGSRKDFIDLYYILKIYSFKDLLNFYLSKYHDGSEFMVRKSAVFFDDADNESTPVLFEEVSWNTIKKEIVKQVLN